MKPIGRFLPLLLGMGLILPSPAGARELKKFKRKTWSKPSRGASFRRVRKVLLDIPYGSHPRQKLDAYLAKLEDPDVPGPIVIWFHGGGFGAGDKREGIPKSLFQNLLSNGVSVVSANYKFAGHEPFPGPMLDGARVVQFVRYYAKSYKIDPWKIGVMGGSAGGGIALWLATQGNLAGRTGNYNYGGMSSRVGFAVAWDGQSTYDPRVYASLFQLTPQDPLFYEVIDTACTLYGMSRTELLSDEAFRLYDVMSAAENASRDDPPIVMEYSGSWAAPRDMATLVHHPKLGQPLAQACARAGCSARMYVYGGGDAKGAFNLIRFMDGIFGEEE